MSDQQPYPPAPGWVPPPGAYGAPQPTWGPQPGWGPQPKRKRFGWFAITLAFLIGGFVSFIVTFGLLIIIGLNYAPSVGTHPAARSEAVLPKVGDCLLPSADYVHLTSDSDVIDCSARHGTEVAAILQMPASARPPSHKDLASYADKACEIAFASYVGTDARRSLYGSRPVVPTRAAWREGDTRVWCLVKAGGVRGTVRNSHD